MEFGGKSNEEARSNEEDSLEDDLYDKSIGGLITFSVLSELLASPILFWEQQ